MTTRDRTPEHSADAAALRSHVHRFIRGLKVLASETTPCGHPLPVSYAHALMVLDGATSGNATLTMGDLAAELGIDKSNVTRLCRRMQDGGHLELKPCDVDGRVRRLRLTADGRRLAGDVDRSSLQRFAEILSRVPEELRGELMRGLDALSGAIGHTLAEEAKR